MIAENAAPADDPAGNNRRTPLFLTPLESEPKNRPFAVFDIESKNDDTQKAGFTRPFMVGFYDGKKYRSFRNSPSVAHLPWYERCVAKGGCIDLFMNHILQNYGFGKSSFAGFDIYAHNMGSFDGLFLPAWLERNHKTITYKIMPVQSRIQAFEIWLYNPKRNRGSADAIKRANRSDRKQFGYIRILDSYRIMPTSLDKIAKAFGLPGKLDDMDLNTHENDPIWEKYNDIDCVQNYEVVGKYKELITGLGGEMGITAPATAIKLLRRKYLKKDTIVHRNVHFQDCPLDKACEGCAHSFFRSAYYGGRTEVYQMKGTGWYYDVNSSYPFSMTLPSPTGDMIELGENEDFTQYAKNPNYVGFVRCTVDIPADAYLPPLPVQHAGKLKFPAGRFSGTWDWCELKVLGRIGGTIIHVEKSVWMKGEAFLTPFVNDLYAMRKPGTPQYRGPALSEVAKIMLNSTFGKFGMDQDRLEMVILKPQEPEPWELRMPGESEDHRKKRKEASEDADNTETPDPKKKYKYHITTILPDESKENFEARSKAERQGDFESQRWRIPEIQGVGSGIYAHDSLVRIRDIRVDADYIIPQIAAHITANSRVLLWSFSMEAIDRKKNIFYSDTDSLLCDYEGFPDSKNLGGLKKEFNGEEITIECFAPKMYRLTKPTPFDGEHARDDSGKQCVSLCPGCLKSAEGKLLSGQHEHKNGEPNCLKKCPGCSNVKIMMKGFPKDYRTSATITKLQRKEEIIYQQHEKLGILAKRGFRDTPRMTTIRKTLRSKYDKRDTHESGDTSPLYFNSASFFSERFQEVSEGLKMPPWLDTVVHLYDPPN